MLLEKNAIEIKDVIKVFEENNINFKIRRLGNQQTLIAKLIDDYSLMVKEDDSRPGYLCACLNSRERGVVTTWHEISHKSLVLAIKYIKEQLGIATKPKFFSEHLAILVTSVTFCLLLGTSFVLVSIKLAQCNTQQSEQLPLQP